VKSCPRCRFPYPDEFALCPKDGSLLEYLREWQPDDVVREKYRIVCKIGQGGMGAIYKAEHLIFEELRALKVLMPQFAHDDSLVRSLTQEARITRRLSHPNAVRVEDVDRAEDGRLFIAMEYVEGKSMGSIIKQSGPMPVLRVIETSRQLCSALDSAHSLGMIHRDIKPDNVLLVRQPDDRDLVKVLDFGIAKIKESAKTGGKEISGITMTKTGFVVGTPQYMSPEQAMGKPGDQLDARSDLYSVGILIYQALTGELPFQADTPMGYLLHHVHTPPPSLAERRPDLNLPDPIIRIVMKALEKDPADRFQSAREMLLALAAAAETFEKETVIRRHYTNRMQRLELSAGSPPAPAGEGQGPQGERPPSPAAVAVAVAGEIAPAVAAGQRPDASWETRRAIGSEHAALFSRIRFARLFELAKQRRIQLGGISVLVAVFAALGLIVRHRSRPVEATTPTPLPPAHVYYPAPKAALTVDHATVEKGRSVTLTWESENATTLDLEPGVGVVQARGSTSVSPPTSTTYTLRATGPGGTKAVTARVSVISPSPTPRRALPTELTPALKSELTDKLVIADIHMNHANYEDAIQAFQDALKIDPSNQQAREGLRKARQLQETLKSIIKQRNNP
jgi:serine/threonine protein kinase